MEAKYTQTIMQEMLDKKYTTVLTKHKVNEKEHNYQQRVLENVDIKSLRLL